jgi:hypothetical protein
MLYEVWPRIVVARQLYCIVGLQWPELKMADDRPPWFMDPNLFVTGAIADMLRIRNLRWKGAMAAEDPYFDANLAREYEASFQFQLQQSANSDESKAQRAYQREWNELLAAGGANYWKSHDMDLSGWRV